MEEKRKLNWAPGTRSRSKQIQRAQSGSEGTLEAAAQRAGTQQCRQADPQWGQEGPREHPDSGLAWGEERRGPMTTGRRRFRDRAGAVCWRSQGEGMAP